MMLVGGFILSGFGALIFSQVYSCLIGSTTCSISATDAADRLGYSFPLLAFGSSLILVGAIFTAAGHISEHVRPFEVSENEIKDEESKLPLRVCLKCGHQVDPQSSYCPKCGNQLSKS